MTGPDVRGSVAAAVATLLGACALTPVFASGAWFPPVVLAIGAVLAGGLLLRRAGARLSSGAPVPRPLRALGTALVPLGQLALLVCVLTAAFAPEGALAGIVPTPESLDRLGGVFADGAAEIREQATPALPLTGLLALTTLFVGLVAILVDLITVAGRQAAVAGIGLLVLVCVPVGTVIGGIGLLALAAPAAGFALLLRVDQERALAGRGRDRKALTGGTGTAVRIGLAALAAGIVLGGVVPTLPEGSFTTGLGGGTGDATGTSLDPAAELRGQLILPEAIELLRVATSVEDPGYLRAVALDEYDPADGWSLSNLDGEISVAEADALALLPDRQATRPVTASIQVLEHDDRFLPVPPVPQSVQVDGDDGAWRFDTATGTVFGRDVTSAGLSYRVSATEPRPSPELLSRAAPLPATSGIQQRFSALPDLDPAIAELTARLTDGAATGYERVQRIQSYLSDRSNGFTYSLSTAPGTSGDDLVDFLRLKRGYCEQYAGAMAVLVRQAGMPARVALGYTPGDVQRDRTRLITSDDAHAWVEVFFDGFGWVPFDPTPIAPDRQVALPWSPRATAEDRADAAPALPVPTSAPQAQVPRADRLPQAVPQVGPQETTQASLRPLLTVLGAVTLTGLVLVSPAALRALQRRRRLAAGGPAGVWDELTASAVDLGLHLHPSWTPRRVADALATAVRRGPGGPAAAAATDAVRGLARAEEAAAYGPPATTGATTGDARLRATLRTARRGLNGARPWPVRVRALLWPASLVDDVRATWNRWRRDAAGRR
ncbi:DUF3488 and transglutaminase-like domain-containing protein [Blastococcus montanus]|uniref:transglutaminase family protein n=1 Tax=Blastococcus montanus TaxID=3144973 RepID=UPI00320AA85E